jgi:hypothetical protein
MAPLHDGFVAAIALAEHAPNPVPFVVAIDHSETTAHAKQKKGTKK